MGDRARWRRHTRRYIRRAGLSASDTVPFPRLFHFGRHRIYGENSVCSGQSFPPFRTFGACVYAYDNGAVDPNVQERYSVLLERRNQPITITDQEKKFLDSIYKAFYNASLDELIELSHEDSEWIEKHRHYRKEEQRMDSMSRREEYAEQYADMIKVLERMEV